MTEDTEADAYDPFDDDAVFRPFSVDDYFDRRVRTDHAPNAALHDALQAANETYDDPVVYNLMASHAPHGAERRAKGEPRYHVRASITNGGMGTASIYDTPIGKLVERGDAVVTHAESSSVFDEPVDREGHADELTVHVRPVTNRTRPVEVPYSDLPDDVFEFHTVRVNAQKVLSHAIDEAGSTRETYEAARCLSTLLALIDPEATDRSIGDRFAEDTIRWLSDKAGAEWEFVEVNDTTTVHFPDEDVDAPDVDHDVDDRFARIRATVGGDEYTDVVREKEKMPDLPPDVDVYVDRVEAVDGTTIACGCGEYAVEVPERALPVTIDVECPVCGNHFGHGRTADEIASGVAFGDTEGPYRAVNEARDAAIGGGYFEPECPTCDYGPLNLNGSASWYKCPSCGDTGKTSTIDGWSAFDALVNPVLRDAFDDGLIDPSMFDGGVVGLADYLSSKGDARVEDLGAPFRRAAEAARRIADGDDPRTAHLAADVGILHPTRDTGEGGSNE